MPIVIIPNTKGTPAGKLADAEVHFTRGLLAGTKLVGFAIWQSNWPSRTGGPNVRVTVPSRDYVGTDGSNKRYDLLRPVDQDDASGLEALRDAILVAYQDQGHEQIDEATAIARETYRSAQQGQVRRPQPQHQPAQRQAPRPRPTVDAELPPARGRALPPVGAPPVRDQVPMRRAAGARPDFDDVPF